MIEYNNESENLKLEMERWLIIKDQINNRVKLKDTYYRCHHKICYIGCLFSKCMLIGEIEPSHRLAYCGVMSLNNDTISKRALVSADHELWGHAGLYTDVMLKKLQELNDY